MRKATHYKVSGVLETKPKNLPEGVEVSEIEVDLPARQLRVNPIHNFGGVTITEYVFNKDSSFGSVGVQWVNMGILSESETRKLRDFLTEILGEDPVILRTFKDTDGDSWFEFEPDKFTMGGFDEDYPKALVVAENRLKDFKESGYGGGFVNQSYEAVSRSHGPLTEFKP